MTHVYDDHGRRQAVTAIQAGPCTIIGLRESARHAYQAIQVGFEPVKEKRLTKPVLGQFKQAKAGPFRYIREFRLPAGRNPSGSGTPLGPDGLRSGGPAAAPDQKKAEAAEPTGNGGAAGTWKVGQQLTVELFQDYELVDVTGVSIGRGFQGGRKRWGWKGGPDSHGSMSHRAPGSIGASATPSRVVRGHPLPGHMGAERVTVQNLRVVRRDPEHHLLLVAGAIPGAEHELVIVRRSAKRPGVIKKPLVVELAGEEEAVTKKKGKGKK